MSGVAVIAGTTKKNKKGEKTKKTNKHEMWIHTTFAPTLTFGLFGKWDDRSCFHTEKLHHKSTKLLMPALSP